MASCPKLYSPAGRGRASTGPYWRRMPRVVPNIEYRLVNASRISPSPPRSGTPAIRVASSTYSSQAAARSASFGFHPPLIDRTPRLGTRAVVEGSRTPIVVGDARLRAIGPIPAGQDRHRWSSPRLLRRQDSLGAQVVGRLLHGKMEQRIPQPGTWLLSAADAVDRPAIRTEEFRQLPARVGVARQDGQHQSVQPAVG